MSRTAWVFLVLLTGINLYASFTARGEADRAQESARFASDEFQRAADEIARIGRVTLAGITALQDRLGAQDAAESTPAP